MREPGSPERDAVLRLICGMNRDQDFTTYFLRAKFSEQIIDEPRNLDSSADMIKFVANVSGAIGYVRADEVDPSVRVIKVDNLAPGDPGTSSFCISTQDLEFELTFLLPCSIDSCYQQMFAACARRFLGESKPYNAKSRVTYFLSRRIERYVFHGPVDSP